MKNLKIIIMVCLSFMFISCSKNVETLPRGSEVDIIVATDIHYLSPQLVQDGPKFEEVYLNGDGKMIQYSDEITDAFIEAVINKKPDVLIISGDLTYNGEKKSHEELALKLEKVKDNGITVLVTPGNHDIRNYNAVRFESDSIETTENISARSFKNIYKELGFNNAIYKDRNSLSYVAEISEDLWVFMIDTNKYDNNGQVYLSDPSGEINEKTLKWLEKYLLKAKNNGVTAITVTHHNLVNHNEVFNSGFTLDNSEEVTTLLNKYDIQANLSGHIHVQDIKEKESDNNKIMDIVTSSLSVYTNQYGQIKFTPGKEILYNTAEVDMELWATENNIKDKNILNFEKYSYSFFEESFYNKTRNDLLQYNLKDEEVDLMAQTVALLNSYYFSGKADIVYSQILESEGYKLWLEKGSSSLRNYIESILASDIPDQNSASISLD